LQVWHLLPIFRPSKYNTVRGSRLFLIVLLGLLGIRSLPAQTRAVLKINPISLTVGTLNLQGEWLINDRMSLNLGVFWGGRTFKEDVPGGKLRNRWVGLTPELRFYPNFDKHAAPRGLYAGPFLRFRHVRSTWLGDAYDPDIFDMLVVHVRRFLPTFSIGGVFGYQFMVKGQMAVDVYTGPYFSLGRPQFQILCAACDGDERPLPPPRMDFSGLELRFGASIGLPF
jgi:hypothetical protein